MSFEFLQVLKEQTKRYPLMEPKDYAKLIYQSEYGPKHLAGGQDVLQDLLQELSSAGLDASPQFPEPIGEDLCRFPISACASAEGAKILARLFVLTAQECRGTKEGLYSKIGQAAEQNIPGMQEFALDWKKQGCPPVRHSSVYRAAYKPHYRLLKKDYSGYFPALLEIGKHMEKGRKAVIAIDGRCGSGKTSFAKLIAQIFPCNVVHMDDFYLPVRRRAGDWEKVPGGNMDLTRLREEILFPIQSGGLASYRPYRCREGRFLELRPFSFDLPTVVEGSYSHHPMLEEFYCLKIFLTCSKEEQLSRLAAREGSYFPVFLERWIPMEENYFRSCKIEQGSGLCLDSGLMR